MSSRLRKLTVLLLSVAAVLALSACGDSHTRVTTGTYAGESGQNAPYLNVGPLIYEVQLSRELNPTNSEDAGYLQGLAPAELALNTGEEWFGVFMQVYNTTSGDLPSSDDFSITDTQGNTYSVVPAADTTAYFGPTQGALLLFKIKVVSLDNRPLILRIVDPNDPTQSASATLDV
jgi:hypothetical protein